MEESDVRKEYKRLLEDSDFDKLELELRKPNIFEILKISRTEIRHSNFLFWLLDPNETHGLGDIFMRKFVRDLATSEEVPSGEVPKLDEFDIGKLNFNNVEIRREWSNIDLLLIFDSLVICIENKIDSKDNSKQLSNYRKNIVKKTFKQKKVYLYLTKTGEEPTEKEEKNFWRTYSYENIISKLEIIIDIYGKSLNPAVYQYIFDYLTTLKRELTMNDEAAKDDATLLAEQIYKSHKLLLDFIYKKKSDIAKQLQDQFKEKIDDKESGLIIAGPSNIKKGLRFLTKKLKDIIPDEGKTWSTKECFLFEIWFSENGVEFKPVISKSSEKIQSIFRDAINSLLKDDGKKDNFETNEGYTSVLDYQVKRGWKTKEGNNGIAEIDIEVETQIKDVWEEIIEIVKKVEDKLSEDKYQTELLNIKQRNR